MQEFAETTLTAEERRERAELARAYMAEHFGVDVTDEESAARGRKLRETLAADTRLWVPVLSVLEADVILAGIAEHIGQLDVIHMLDLDYPAVLAVAQLCRDGVPAGVAAAVHAARHLPEWRHSTGRHGRAEGV